MRRVQAKQFLSWIILFFSFMVLSISPSIAEEVSQEDDPPKVPAIAVHIEKHEQRGCKKLPRLTRSDLTSTYDGMGEIDAFVVLLEFGEAKAAAFGLKWPENWGSGRWQDCSYLKIGNIVNPGDVIRMVFNDCQKDSLPLILGWITLTVNSPGRIEVIPDPKEGYIAFVNCPEASPTSFEPLVKIPGGAGGARGDEVSALENLRNRNWYVSPDTTGMTSIASAIRSAIPGDTVFVSGGTYKENILLKPGVVIMGSWDRSFKRQDLHSTPSILVPRESESVVRGSLREDTTAVLDGFVITGGKALFGGAIALRNGSSPRLSNLIVYRNSADYGGGIACHSSSPIVRNVLIIENQAEAGGAIHCMDGASPRIISATLVGNRAKYGGGLFAKFNSSPSIERTLIVNNSDGAVYSDDESCWILIECCLLWENLPEDWKGKASQTVVLEDVKTEDPAFTDAASRDLSPRDDSPAMDKKCGRIGSLITRLPSID
ncbi:MAG: hypothetical protein ACUVUU_07000 [bacterium]